MFLRVLLLGVCGRLRLVVRVWQRHVGQGVALTMVWRDPWELRTTMLNSDWSLLPIYEKLPVGRAVSSELAYRFRSLRRSRPPRGFA